MAALTTSNVSDSGIGGGRRIVTGQWTGSLGDATATLAATGTFCYGAQLLTNDTDYGTDVPISWSATGGVLTVTVAAALTVTTGTFFLIVG